jgi:hypothetical protein
MNTYTGPHRTPHTRTLIRCVCIMIMWTACAGVCTGSPGWHWLNPEPQGNFLNAVWVAAPDDAWAVGEYAIMHWDGSDWSVHMMDKSLYLRSIFGFSEDNIWASGSNDLLLHWDGSAWQKVPLETTGYLGTIWGISPDDIWMATNIKGMLYHFDGTIWELFDTGTEQLFSKFWGAAADDIWAIGDQGSLLHWNGESWSVEDKTFYYLDDIHGVSETDIRVIGCYDFYYPPFYKFGVVLRWDGTEWEIEDGWLNPDMSCIWGAAPDDFWIGGNGMAMYHWDGKQWKIFDFDNKWHVYDMGGTSGTDIWGCGAAGTLVHMDGTGWNAAHSGSQSHVYDICSLSPWNAWSAQHDSTRGIGSVYHWDGSRWRLVLEAPGTFSAVDVHESTVWVAGYDTSWCWNGNAWIHHPIRFGSWIETIHVFSETDVIAQGYHDLFHWDGAAWSSIAQFDAELLTMFCISRDDIWVGGAAGTGDSPGILQHWNGTEWSPVIETPIRVSSIWGPATDDLWAVGSIWGSETGMVLRWDGNHWFHQQVDTIPAGPESIWGSSSDDVWMVNRYRYLSWFGVSHWNGLTWTPFEVCGHVSEVTGSGPGDVWAYGYHGAILHYPDDPSAPAVQIDLAIPGTDFYPGDPFHLHTHTRSNTGQTERCRLFTALSWAGQYWFYPGWVPYYPDHTVDYEMITVINETNVLIPEFTWPDIDTALMNLTFIGACTDPEHGFLTSNISVKEFNSYP